MADISDVEQALVSCITNLVYPLGSTQSSIIGTTCRIYRGWPNTATLNADLRVEISNITIVPDDHSGKTTTRYLPSWTSTQTQPGLAVSVICQTIMMMGSPALGDVVGTLIDGQSFAYRVNDHDTPDLVAANVCDLIGRTTTATVIGSTIVLSNARSIVVRVVSDGIANYEGRRQEKDVRVICWSPSPPMRDSLAAAIDQSVAGINFLSMPDGSHARIVYKNTTTTDQSQNAMLYRRDLIYSVEYPTTVICKKAAMLFGAAAINGQITFG